MSKSWEQRTGNLERIRISQSRRLKYSPGSQNHMGMGQYYNLRISWETWGYIPGKMETEISQSVLDRGQPHALHCTLRISWDVQGQLFRGWHKCGEFAVWEYQKAKWHQHLFRAILGELNVVTGAITAKQKVRQKVPVLYAVCRQISILHVMFLTRSDNNIICKRTV